MWGLAWQFTAERGALFLVHLFPFFFLCERSESCWLDLILNCDFSGVLQLLFLYTVDIRTFNFLFKEEGKVCLKWLCTLKHGLCNHWTCYFFHHKKVELPFLVGPRSKGCALQFRNGIGGTRTKSVSFLQWELKHYFCWNEAPAYLTTSWKSIHHVSTIFFVLIEGCIMLVTLWAVRTSNKAIALVVFSVVK